jgi:hypothetical protein
MILPNNGKVVIIDDQPKDVIELISALSKEKVPFVHYKEEDLSDLPDSPIENVRLIFLDLELITDTYLSAKNVTSPIKTRLMRVLKPHTAYALIIWSKKENDYKQALLDDFENEFSAYKPIFHTSLPKADIIGKKGAMDKIKKELKIEISKFKSFNAFLIWESIVNESSGKLTNEIASLYPPNNEWDNKTKFLLYKLAVAYSGKTVKNFDEIQQLKNALYTLTLTFTDNIDNSIDKLINRAFSDLISSTEQHINDFTTVINKLLLISDGNDDVTQPGNLFFPDVELQVRDGKNENDYISRKSACFKIPEEKQEIALSGIEKSYKSEKQKIKETIASTKKTNNEITVSALKESSYSDEVLVKQILDSVVPIELNITPLCDYAQEKAKRYRILPGVMIKSLYREHLNFSPSYLYISDADFRIDNCDYLLIFDFRFLYSLLKKELEGKIVKFRLKQQLLSDIQIKLGSHVNRSGVVFVN